KKTRSIKKLKLPKKTRQNRKFITMDIETILINNIHIPYLLCWYDGHTTYNYFIKSLLEKDLDNNILDMIKRLMKDLNIKKYDNYNVYFHNFSKFDAYFLIKQFSKLGFIEPIIHKGRIISLEFINKNNSYILNFKDSYLMLPSSLRNLCKSFDIENHKGIFPFKLNDIKYNGEIPDFDKFEGINLLDYENYKVEFKDKIWNFRDEAIKYCRLDCKSLFQILTKFNKLIFDKFKLNIVKYPTKPSLSFNLFRT